jgi:hypothetical protein
MAEVEDRYLGGGYLEENPDWHRTEAPWKAANVSTMLADNSLRPTTLCEIGCGSGDVLVHLQRLLPHTQLSGFDIAPQAQRFWQRAPGAESNIQFTLGDFHQLNRAHYDVLLMLDVFEHVRDPFSFLEKSRSHATHFVFHIPLDLSASSVARGTPLLDARRRVGHLHYYTKDLALETLTDSGYEVLSWRYTGAALNAPGRSLKARLAALPRRLAYAINRDAGVRLLGGDTLMVLARSAAASPS